MERLVIVAAALAVVAFGTAGQGPARQQESPTEVVESFWKFETEGGRLTPEGWSKGGSFFVRPHLAAQQEENFRRL